MAITPVVLGVDVEPDDRRISGRPAVWSGVEPMHVLLERWRPRFEEVTGAPVSYSWFWRTDPQVERLHGDPTWALREFSALRVDTTAKGDAHGTHPHTWRWDDSRDDWIQDNADPAWIEHCVATSVDAFREVVGTPCRIARMGDRGLDVHAYRALTRHDVAVDLSVEPGHAPWDFESRVPSPDYTEAPVRPYRPRRHDVSAAARFRRGPVILPLSAARIGGVQRPLHWWTDEATDVLDQSLAQGVPYVAFAGRSDIPTVPEHLERFVTLLEAILRHPQAPMMRFVTPEVAVAMLRRRRPLGNFRPLR